MTCSRCGAKGMAATGIPARVGVLPRLDLALQGSAWDRPRARLISYGQEAIAAAERA